MLIPSQASLFLYFIRSTAMSGSSRAVPGLRVAYIFKCLKPYLKQSLHRQVDYQRT